MWSATLCEHDLGVGVLFVLWDAISAQASWRRLPSPLNIFSHSEIISTEADNSSVVVTKCGSCEIRSEGGHAAIRIAWALPTD
ncbi:hypothetical protein CYMTET_26973 [Cymbomonas tetramitiformis]|uniref:Uncharacterized protein n=1 Tax=Cymbomonas tetramitiformis TaxID=36881 RepID=A0AAE0BQ95_9CHLO|nr:hypothetical protein CYMTET_49446 [Cymbomonas tetramitiformis]KAK3264277.1 hypothetical protein CYMTET_26973 [Cymbomonas tetramitiformis]